MTQRKHFKNKILFILSFILLSCGDSTSTQTLATEDQNQINAQNPCSSKSAIIVFHDNLSQTFCGCKEASTLRSFQLNEELTCTVSQNTVITFHFQNISHSIQLHARTLNSKFPTLPLVEPKSEKPINSLGYEFSSTGTFHYENTLNPAIYGKIIVTP